jgi:hypothetical protein
MFAPVGYLVINQWEETLFVKVSPFQIVKHNNRINADGK